MVMNHDYKIQLFQGMVILETWFVGDFFFLHEILGFIFNQDREQFKIKGSTFRGRE